MNSRPVFHTALFGALACCLMAALVSCNRPENHTPPAAGVFQEIERLGETVRLESDERVAIANSRLRL